MSSNYSYKNFLSILILLAGIGILSADAAVESLSSEFFETKIRPVLVDQCYDCHSVAANKTKGGLLLDSPAGLLAGGDTGPAIVPGKPAESLLYKAITHQDKDLEMPAKKPKLPDSVIADFHKWITDGAPWPGGQTVASTNSTKTPFSIAQRKERLPWIWETPKKQTLPSVNDPSWPSTDADYFVLSKLEEKNLAPATPAEPEVWLRRVFFALTGLPPTPTDLTAFLTDKSPKAREKVVDQLLNSPHFGEHWARHWMDLVRYAESRGHESDFIIANAYHYRDYLIRAFNTDLPYDQFVREQLAGDLIPAPRINPTNGANESVLGTGWAFLGEEIHSPVDIRQDECDRTDNKVDVIGKTFLGLTLGCARCHDHKFDAIAAKDYYAMSGFVLSSSYRQVPFESMEQNHRVALKLQSTREKYRQNLVSAFTSSIKPGIHQVADYLLAAQKATHADLDLPITDRIARLAVQDSLSADKLTRWLDYLAHASTNEIDPFYLTARAVTGPDATQSSNLQSLFSQTNKSPAQTFPKNARILADYSKPEFQPWKVDGEAFGNRPLETGEVCFGQDSNNPIAGVMIHGAARRDPFWNKFKAAQDNEKDSGELAATARSGQMLATPTFTLKGGKLHYLIKGKALVYAAVSSHLMIAGPLHAQLIHKFETANNTPVWVTQDLSRYSGQRTHLEFGPVDESPLEVMMVVEAEESPKWIPGNAQGTEVSKAKSFRQLAKEQEATILGICQRMEKNTIAGTKDAEDQSVLADWLVQHQDLLLPARKPPVAPVVGKYVAELKQLDQQARWESHTAVAWFDGTGVDENILVRGKAAKPGAMAPRSLPAAFNGAMPIQTSSSSGRYELARQMTDANNPLVARVIVNRIWHHLFGRGIVATVDNFGYLGERPTHPELLDHLAWQFVHEEGWSQKKLIKKLVLSKTFSMSSKSADAHEDEVDGANLLLHRMPVRRLEAESIHDSLLVVSGRFNPAMEGPPIPVHLTDFIIGRGRPDKSGPLDGDGRRSIYSSVRRNFLSTFMLTFDMPSPFSTMGRRNVTNVPAQSLSLMNDPLVHDQAHVWAERLLRDKKGASVEERIRWMFEAAYGRGPAPSELDACRASLAEFKKLESTDDTSPQTWTDLCHSLFCANDFIYLR